MIRAVLFDLGNTLFTLDTTDPRRLLQDGIRSAYGYLADRGFDLPPVDRYVRRVARRLRWAYFRSQLTLREIPLLDLTRRVHRRMGLELDQPTLEQYARCCHRVIHKSFRPAPGVHDALRRIHRAGYRIGLVSNTFMISKVLDEELQAAGLLDVFSARIYSCDVGYLKPHPRIFRAALDALGANAAESMFVGDLLNVDVKGAARLGMTTVLVAPNGRVPAGRHHPDHVVRQVSEVPELLADCRPPAANEVDDA
jgi:putative hydrolase of the HAD superfamily